MRIYVGQTRSAKLIRALQVKGWGEMTVRKEYPPRRKPWAFDNGAFKDFTAKRVFDARAFEEVLERIRAALPSEMPDFLVVPDIVAGGNESLAFSAAWLPRCRVAAPCYLAVQDGMTEAEVSRAAAPYQGLFVGGTLKWKIHTAARWVALAHELGKACHVGRVGTFKRVRWARRIGADSIDSCLPLWSAENMRAFERGVTQDPHPELFR